MSAEARIFILVRDDHDRPDWGDPIHTLPGHWDPRVALLHYCFNEDVPPGTYQCKAGGATATVNWDGERAA